MNNIRKKNILKKNIVRCLMVNKYLLFLSIGYR